MKYTIKSLEDNVSTTIEAEDMDAAKEAAVDWMRDGEWGNDGARVSVSIRYYGPPRFRAGTGDGIEVHTDCGWGYVTTDSESGLSDAEWRGKGDSDLRTLVSDVAPLVAMAALIAAIPDGAQDAEVLAEETIEVEIEPDHAAKIKEATGHAEICGTDPDDHDWTSEGEGGLDENPGVWATGGTSIRFESHCRACGLHRTEYVTGSQRNPDDHDTTEYSLA